MPDLGDGRFRNPVIFADYSDPDVARMGDDYYLVASSFNVTPALPILHSRDLVNWTIVGHAAARLPSPRYDTPQHGQGVWAPSLRVHGGRFWIYFGDPDLGIFMTSAVDPRGPWEPLQLVQSASGWIDPCPLWDDDGSVYLVHAWAKSRAGFNSVLTLRRLTPDGRRSPTTPRHGVRRHDVTTDDRRSQVLQARRLLLHLRAGRRRDERLADRAAIEVRARTVRGADRAGGKGARR